MKINISRGSKKPVYWQIIDQIKTSILSNELPDGAILPSERQMARSLGVHRSTVIKAYNELKQMELIESKKGIGHLVTAREKPSNAPSYTVKNLSANVKSISGSKRSFKINWSHIIKDEYLDMEETFDKIFQRSSKVGMISMGKGVPQPAYDNKELAGDLEKILSHNDKTGNYIAPYQGDSDLRRNIISMLRKKGIRATPRQIQVLSETNQAIDFIITTMLSPGDKVIIEEPVSPDIYRPISLAGCKAITVPMDENGMNVEVLKSLIEKHHPKFILVNSSFHDPTGIIMSNERKLQLLELSNTYSIPIVEEDAASELYFGNKSYATLKSMDKNNNVIYIYSFSLTFVPGLSMAFVVGDERLIHSLKYLVSVRMMSLDWMTQKLLSKCIEDGRYEEKTRLMARQNYRNMKIVTNALKKLERYGLKYIEPKGGVYVWCTLPEYINARSFVKEAFTNRLEIIAGYIFYPLQSGGQNMIRINFSFESSNRIKKGMDIFSEVFMNMLELSE